MNPYDQQTFWGEAFDVLAFRAGHNTSVVIAGAALLGAAAGIVGAFALLRKRAMMADALSHATLPGVAGAFLLATAIGRDGKHLPLLLAGSAVSGVAGVLAVQAIVRWTRVHVDAAIGIVLSVFFGVGVVLLSVIQATGVGNPAGLDHFLYGQAAAMRVHDVWVIAWITGIAAVAAVLLRKEFAVVCFNDAFARVTGWPVKHLDVVMMALVTLVTVAGLPSVGALMVVALLVIPPAAARFWTERFVGVLAVSMCIGAGSGYIGAVVSALSPGEPTGAVIVLVAGGAFLISAMCAPSRGIFAAMWRGARLRIRIAEDHVLEAMFAAHGDTRVARSLCRFTAAWGWTSRAAVVVAVSLWVRGFLRRSGGVWALTERGEERGARVARNHALWKRYLILYADVAPSHVDWAVDQVEHVLSEDLVAELQAALDADPGGRCAVVGETT